MNKEIEIPEGYEAKIENGKIILMPKESKDEKIRKSLLCHFKHRARPYWNGLAVNDIIDWLENHTEATWTEEDESFVTHILPRILNPYGWTSEQISADKKYLTEFIKRQKGKFHTKLSDADEGMLNCIIATLCEESHGGREANDKMVSWLDKLRKSIRHYSHWKPSNDQMEALHDAIGKSRFQATLYLLYNDLEKLM